MSLLLFEEVVVVVSQRVGMKEVGRGKMDGMRWRVCGIAETRVRGGMRV